MTNLTNVEILLIGRHHFKENADSTETTLNAYCDSVRAVITSYGLTREAATVPAGWKLVPIKPTGDMLDALLSPWHDGSNRGERETLEKAYAGALAAAPASTAADSQTAKRYFHPSCSVFEDMLRSLEHVEAVYRLNVIGDSGDPSSTLDNLQRVIARAAAAPLPRASDAAELVIREMIVVATSEDDDPDEWSIDNRAQIDMWQSRLQDALATAAQPVADDTDTALMDWLQEELVDTIYLDDGRIIDVGGKHQNDLRAALTKRRADATGVVKGEAK